MKKRIYLSPPHQSGLELSMIQQVLESNWLAPVGPQLDAWETEIVEMTGSGDCCLFNSASAAIHLGLILLDIKPGDLVFIQSHTHIASVNPIIYQGATPVFIDSEPGSWNMSPGHLEKAIQDAIKGKIHPHPLGTPASGGHRPSLVEGQRMGNKPQTTNGKPKAILPVHLYGMPANMDAIMEVARKYNIPVIEDAAESLGSTYKGKHTGTIGQMGVYSFNGNKIITTSGGGALVSDREEWISKARFLATQARDDAPHYQHSHIGYNYRMSNVLAGIGRGQMQVLPERIKQRRANFERYREYFSKWNQKGFHITFQEEAEGSFSNRWLSCIIVDPAQNNGLTREKIRLEMEAENIECRPLWKPMHLQPVFESYPYVGDNTAELLFQQGLCLPSGSSLNEDDFNRIFKVLDHCFNTVLH